MHNMGNMINTSYKYNLGLEIIIKGAIVSLVFLVTFLVMMFEASGSNNRELFNIAIIGTIVMLVFIAVGPWRFLVSFFHKNNRVVLGKEYLIFPGFLQMLPEVVINFSDIERVEYSEIGEGANYLIKIYRQNNTRLVTKMKKK